MGIGRPAAMCVVTVDDGPGGVRWALLAVNLDPARDPEAVERKRVLSSSQVVARVAQFLTEAGLDDPPPG